MKGSLADGARFGFRQKEFASLPSHDFAPATNCTYERTIDGREYANGTKEEKEKKGCCSEAWYFGFVSSERHESDAVQSRFTLDDSMLDRIAPSSQLLTFDFWKQ